MMLSIGCVDGKVYHSDHMPDTELQEYLDSVDGNIGTNGSTVIVHTPEAVREWMLSLCKYDSKNDTQTVTLNINGRSRQFNAIHIVWAQMTLDSDVQVVKG